MLNSTRRHSPRLLIAAAAFAATVPATAVHAQPVPQPGPGEVGSCDNHGLEFAIYLARGRSPKNSGHIGECDPATYGVTEDDIWSPDQSVIKAYQAKVKAYFDRLAQTPPAPVAAPRTAPVAAAPALPSDAPASQPLAPAASDVPVSAPSDCSDLAAVANTDTGVADDGADGPPSEDVIRQTIQAQFMVDYVKPITCLRPAVEIGRIQVGAPIDKVIHLFDSDTTSAYPVKSVVKINIFSGDTYLRSYQRGVNGEIFFLYRDDFGAWRLVTGRA